jgi:hypothetical protein
MQVLVVALIAVSSADTFEQLEQAWDLKYRLREPALIIRKPYTLPLSPCSLPLLHLCSATACMHAISSIFSAIYMLTWLLTWLSFVLLLQCCVYRSCPTNYSVEREHTALHATVAQLRADVATVQSAAAAQQRAELLAAAAAAAAAASSSASSTSASSSSSGQRLSSAAATLATAQLITLKLGAIALVQQAEVDGRTLPRTADGSPLFLPGNGHTCNAYSQPETPFLPGSSVLLCFWSSKVCHC